MISANTIEKTTRYKINNRNCQQNKTYAYLDHCTTKLLWTVTGVNTYPVVWF